MSAGDLFNNQNIYIKKKKNKAGTNSPFRFRFALVQFFFFFCKQFSLPTNNYMVNEKKKKTKRQKKNAITTAGLVLQMMFIGIFEGLKTLRHIDITNVQRQ